MNGEENSAFEMEETSKSASTLPLANSIEEIDSSSNKFVSQINSVIKKNKRIIKIAINTLLIILVLVYYSLTYYYVLKPTIGKSIYNTIKRSVANNGKRVALWAHLTFVFALLVIVVVFLAIEIREVSRLQSLVGIFSLIIFGFLLSNKMSKVNWRVVAAGILVQMVLGLLLIKWPAGRSAFQCFGNKVATFLGYANSGSEFVYGKFLVENGVFAFTVLPVIFFFSFMVSILYYLGAMQWFVLTVGWVLQTILGTTVCESVNAAADMFLGQSESILTIKPYLKDLTRSEYHAIMVAGFSTVSGSVMAAYITFGANPAHLVTASVMAAPASLTFAKLFYPETEVSKTSSSNIQLAKSEDASLLDAATKGASDAIMLVLGITANLVAFISFMAFINGILGYLSGLLGYEPLTLEYIFGKVFTPVSWALGIPWEEASLVGELIGLKTIVNEFVAYQKLGEYKKANLISLRSSGIATFALCGFANPSSMGIMIGAMSSLEPSRRSDITAVAFRAFIAGSCVTFMTASIAGLLMTDDMFIEESMLTLGNHTGILI
uniref:Sodium/nucleoside cotransporter n=1 Tax=Culicoides sonorensis TaxID=179676 RepID=A0A336LH21_CULSO